MLAARKGADTAEIKRLEGSELLQLSAGEQKRLQEQLADAKFRCTHGRACGGNCKRGLLFA